jgi:hypothetical protein
MLSKGAESDAKANYDSELQVLGALQGKSPFLVPCLGYYETPEHYCIVMRVSSNITQTAATSV